jgi:hypothetical protein
MGSERESGEWKGIEWGEATKEFQTLQNHSLNANITSFPRQIRPDTFRNAAHADRDVDII